MNIPVLIQDQVADSKNNLYIGIKQAGAFQHSSFLHGARVSAAGLITVKDGQLRSKWMPSTFLSESRNVSNDMPSPYMFF